MIALENSTLSLEPFVLGLYAPPGATRPDAVPTPLLDPASLEAAFSAYDDAVGALRKRVRRALRPRVRHSLANKILGFAIFGERDRRSLKERALAHFP